MNWYTRVEPECVRPAERERWQKAARLIRDFVAGKITNDEFEDGWPLGPGDPALNDVFNFVWRFYDDLSTHRFKGGDAAAAELLRCAAFLETDLQYIWRTPHWTIRPATSVLGIVTLGLANRVWDAPPRHWPFPTLEAAQQNSNWSS
jgi:hypothetical protein